MSDAKAKFGSSRKIVVIFDICCSTTILEDLVRTENQKRWDALLGNLKRFMWTLQNETSFTMYKFMGDGWILLFEDGAATGAQLLDLAQALCLEYDRLFRVHIADVLSSKPKHVGITFGVDEGTLMPIVMNRNVEFVGRALNVAARLQTAVKQQKGTPPGTLLMSKNAFSRLRVRRGSELVECKLANVTGGDAYEVHVIRVHDAA